MKPSKIAVLGGGSWGTTTASVISRNCQTVLWARDATIVDQVNNEHRNHRYLEDAALHPKLTATEDIQSAVYAVGKAAAYDNLRDWFKCLYEVLLGQSEGPRMGSFFALYGRDKSVQLINDALAGRLSDSADADS